MPIDKARLDAYIAEVAADMAEEDKTQFIALLSKNDKLAENTVNGHLRHSDYTRKTQELAQQKTALESSVSTQVQEYAKQLQQAEQRIAKIMDDFEKAKISEATANARLLKVKETYKLDDNDIPPIDPATVNPNPRSGAPAGPQIDIDKKLNEFKTEFVRTLLPEMTAMARVNAAQIEIDRQHVALTGSPLSESDMNGLITESIKSSRPLKAVWEEKYNIPTIRQTKHEEGLKSKWQQEWEAEQAQRRSEEALAGVRNRDTSTGRFSPVLGREFTKSDPGTPAAPGQVQPPKPATPPVDNGQRLSGAERAAARWMERRAAGIAPGTPLAPANK